MIKFTFGMIVLNGEPFLRFNLRSLYPHAHEIIVVEGAVPDIENQYCSNGHSIDGTVETLDDFKKNEDPENKLIIVKAEDEGYKDGYWPGEKDEQSRAYAERASGNYLWQVDADEFYLYNDIETVRKILEDNPEITAVSFPMLTFWGNPNVVCDSWYLRRGASTYHRLFKWGKGYQYTSHRPPTVLDSKGIDTREIYWFDSKKMKKKGIFLYHYSLLFPRQVKEKCSYYANANWANRKGAKDWFQNVYMNLDNPFRVHNVFQYPGWLTRWNSVIPDQVIKMWNSIYAGDIQECIRASQDIDVLLNSWSYRVKIVFYKIFDYICRIEVFLNEKISIIKGKLKLIFLRHS